MPADYQQHIPPEYRKDQPDGSCFTVGDFAEIVTAETLQYFLVRLAHESKSEKHCLGCLEVAASALDMDMRELRRRLAEIFATTNHLPINSDNIIIRLNNVFAVVMAGSRCVILEEFTEPVFKHPDIRLISQSDFKNFHAHRTVLVPDERDNRNMVRRPVTEVWLKSPLRRQYEGIVFMPGIDIPRYYNLWRGLACQPQQGDWCLMRDHIRNIICAGDADIFQWVIAWLARIVQNPGGERPGTSLVLRGKQGTGKGIFVSSFGSLFGSHFVHLIAQRQLTGRFNAHLKNALVVFCDEAVWAGSKEAAGTLKGLVTEESLPLEMKGIDIFHIRNNINLIIASNNKRVIPADWEERRFCVLDVSDAAMQDKVYFEAIVRQMAAGGREAMLYDLLHHNISGIDLRTIPRTEALFDQILQSMNSIEKFWLDCLRHGRILGPFVGGWPIAIEAEQLRHVFHDYARTIGDRNGLSATEFGKQLRDVCPGIVRGRQTSSGRPYEYRFPPLLECRRQFEKNIDMTIPWDEAEDDG